MRKLLFVLLVSVVALAQGDRKADLVQMMSISARCPVEAQMTDKLMTFNMSPQAWDYVLNPDHTDAMNTLRNLAGNLAVMAGNLKLGDPLAIDRASTYDGKSPLVADAIDALKGKVDTSVTIQLADPAEIAKAVLQLSYCIAPFQNDYYFHPRGGQAHLSFVAERKAKGVDIKISKDGNSYAVTVPVYADVSQSRMEQLLPLGRAPR